MGLVLRYRTVPILRRIKKFVWAEISFVKYSSPGEENGSVDGAHPTVIRAVLFIKALLCKHKWNFQIRKVGFCAQKQFMFAFVKGTF
jgi:hypothetical protein